MRSLSKEQIKHFSEFQREKCNPTMNSKLSDGNPKLKAKDFSITPSNKNI